MRTGDGRFDSALSGYWKVLRIGIVIFFLFLLGDAFFRWDGFKYYATFYEFIPSLALITVLWAILAVCSAFLTWGLLKALEWLGHRVGMKISIDHMMMAIVFFLLFGAIAWKIRQFISSHYEITNQVRLIVLTIVTLTAFILTYLFRNKAMRWMQVIHERITPMVWLFIAAIILSVPLVIYHTWIKQTDSRPSQKVERPVVKGKDRPNIILVSFDTLTSRNMSVYNYHRETTPFISKWSKTASLFTKLEAEGNITTPTTASLMTGKRLWTHQAYHLKGRKPSKVKSENLPLLLKNHGYYNMAFVANGFASVKVLGVEKSFDIAPISTQFYGPKTVFGHLDKFLYQVFGEKIKLHDWILQGDFILYRLLNRLSPNENVTAYTPETVFNSFLWAIDGKVPEPYFAWVHVYPPHNPYLPPEPFIGMFDPSSGLRSNRSQENLSDKALKYVDSFAEFPKEIKHDTDILKTRYDEFITYCDRQFEEFVSQLNKRNILKNSVIIFTLDHGESFEHGYIRHGDSHLYEQVTNIPLIIKEPDQTEGRVIDDLVEQVDVPATILDLAGISVPSWMEGRSLLPPMRGEKLPSQYIFSMAFEKNPSRQHQITRGAVAMWEGDYKLIHYLDHDNELLYNLRRDPDEQINLIDSAPEIGQRMLRIIKDNLAIANEKIKNSSGR